MKKRPSSNRWLNEHFNDIYVQKAKKLGYRSRAAFKLLEIQEKDRLLRPSANVIDLGSSPGSWSVIAKKQVGDKGRVFAIDILPMEPVSGVEFLQGDFNDEKVVFEFLTRIDNCPIDLVMSDMAPNTTGVSTVDQLRFFQLAEQGLAFMQQVLKPGGAFLVKVFQGEGFEPYLKQMRSLFKQVKVRKPAASRGRSNEVYLVGLDSKL